MNPSSPEQPIRPTETQSSPDQLVQPTGAPANANAARPAAPALTASDVAAVIAQMPATGSAAQAAATPPPAAADQDVIEPEWVDQAEAVIARTAGDPHAEEEAVEALQVDYLAKRYGHQVKKDGQDA